jgi:hypothetical protein
METCNAIVGCKWEKKGQVCKVKPDCAKAPDEVACEALGPSCLWNSEAPTEGACEENGDPCALADEQATCEDLAGCLWDILDKKCRRSPELPDLGLKLTYIEPSYKHVNGFDAGDSGELVEDAVKKYLGPKEFDQALAPKLDEKESAQEEKAEEEAEDEDSFLESPKQRFRSRNPKSLQ